MTFFTWLLLFGVLALAVDVERNEMWWLHTRLHMRRLMRKGDGPTEWS